MITVKNLNFGPVNVVVQIKLKILKTLWRLKKSCVFFAASFSHVESSFFGTLLIKNRYRIEIVSVNMYLFVDRKRKYCDASVFI